MIASGGGIVLAAGFFGWPAVWVAGGLVLALLAPVILRAPGRALRVEEKRLFFRPLLAWLRRPGSVPALLFVLLYKLGDQAITPMIKPFWVDRHLTLAEIGLISTTLGIVFTILGALLGGFLTTKWGLLKALLHPRDRAGAAEPGVRALRRARRRPARDLRHVGPGVLRAGARDGCFLTMMMRLCDKEHAATEYALISALFSLTRHISGAASGLPPRVSATRPSSATRSSWRSPASPSSRS
jgi:PAT family beta-lactamase induction signal transducer AmpG